MACFCFDPADWADILNECGLNTGGVQKVYFAPACQVSSYTLGADEDEGKVTAVTMTSPGQFYKMEFWQLTGTFNEPSKINNENGTGFFETELSGTLRKRGREKRNQIQKLIGVKLHFIVQDNNDTYWYLGIRNGAYISEVGGGVGSKLDDLNGYTLKFTCNEPQQAYVIDESIVLTLI